MRAHEPRGKTLFFPWQLPAAFARDAHVQHGCNFQGDLASIVRFERLGKVTLTSTFVLNIRAR